MGDGRKFIRGVESDLVLNMNNELGKLLPSVFISDQKGDLSIDATGLPDETKIDVIGKRNIGDIDIVTNDADAAVNVRNRQGDVSVATQAGADAITALGIDGKLKVNTAEGTDLVTIDGNSDARIDTGKDEDFDVVIVDGARRADFDVSTNADGHVVLINKHNDAEVTLCNVDGISFRGDGNHSEIISPVALLKDAESAKGSELG